MTVRDSASIGASAAQPLFKNECSFIKTVMLRVTRPAGLLTFVRGSYLQQALRFYKSVRRSCGSHLPHILKFEVWEDQSAMDVNIV